jgi:hypothetical protein
MDDDSPGIRTRMEVVEPRGADGAAGAGQVLHRHRLAELPLERLREGARHEVGAAARPEGDDERDGLARELLLGVGGGRTREQQGEQGGQAGDGASDAHVGSLLTIEVGSVRRDTSRAAIRVPSGSARGASGLGSRRWRPPARLDTRGGKAI